MPAKPDPLSEVRRENFRAYCRKRWDVAPSSRWPSTLISAAAKKPVNKISDLLNGKGSFGAPIARDLESELGISPGWLDGLSAKQTPPHLSFIELTGLESQLVMLFRALPPDDQNDLLTAANNLHSMRFPDHSPANPTGGKTVKEERRKEKSK